MYLKQIYQAEDKNSLLDFLDFLSLSFSFSFSPAIWNIEAGFELLFFLLLLLLLSGSLSSSLSDLAAA